MREASFQELQELADKLLATARNLPSGQDRHNALREIRSFHVRIAALKFRRTARSSGAEDNGGERRE
jgi:hypothetical protein